MDEPEYKGVVELGAVFTKRDADAWRTRLLEALNTEKECLALDGSDIESIDGVGLQLLASLMLEATEVSKVIVWKGVSNELVNSARLLGLSDVLGFDSAD